MDIHQLQCFVAVAEEGTFTAAGLRMHLAQSGVSAHIKALEREVGQQLFERHPRAAKLTAAGEALLPHVRAAMEALASGRAAVDGLTGLLRGRVAIGTITSISPRSVDLPQLLASFHRRHPGVDLSLIEDAASMLTQRITDGRLDVAFTSLTDATTRGMQVRELHREAVIAVLPPSSALARHDEVSLGELAEHPLIALPEGSGLRWQLDRALERAAVRARIAFEASDPDVLVALVEQGLGVGLVPESALAQSDRLVGVRVSDLPPGRLGIIWRDRPTVNPAAQAFVEHATTMSARTRRRQPR